MSASFMSSSVLCCDRRKGVTLPVNTIIKSHLKMRRWRYSQFKFGRATIMNAMAILLNM